MDTVEPVTILAVQDLFTQYAQTVDRRDFDGFAELFTDDAEYVRPADTTRGRAAITELMRGILTFAGGAHIVSNVSVRPAGDDRYDAVAHFLFTRRLEEGGPLVVLSVGSYEAEVARDDNGLRFATFCIRSR